MLEWFYPSENPMSVIFCVHDGDHPLEESAFKEIFSDKLWGATYIRLRHAIPETFIRTIKRESENLLYRTGQLQFIFINLHKVDSEEFDFIIGKPSQAMTSLTEAWQVHSEACNVKTKIEESDPFANLAVAMEEQVRTSSVITVGVSNRILNNQAPVNKYGQLLVEYALHAFASLANHVIVHNEIKR